MPTDTPGIEITPIYTLGERTNMTYYADVVVEDRWRVGEVNQGWEVLMTALGLRARRPRLPRPHDVASSTSPGPFRVGRPGGRLPPGPSEIGRFSADVEVARLLDHRTAWIHSQNRRPGVEGSMAKLFASEHYTSYCATLLDLMGPTASSSRARPRPPAAAGWSSPTATPPLPRSTEGRAKCNGLSWPSVAWPYRGVADHDDRRPPIQTDLSPFDFEAAPLAGLRVVDFTHLVAGPFCTMLLSDAGASVFKIEPPWGDSSRFRGARRDGADGRHVSGYVVATNRGKQSVVLDLKSDAGQQMALD